MKLLFTTAFFLMSFCICGILKAQPLSGLYTINNTQPSVGTNYSSFTAAINALNANGVASGGAVFNVQAGQVFSELPPSLVTSGVSTGRIVFQKFGSSSNPTILGTNGIGSSDAIIKIVGSSYITFDGIDLKDNPVNTTNVFRMEYGYQIINGGSPLKGCQQIILKNSRVTLNRLNTTVGVMQSSNPALGGGSFSIGNSNSSNNSNRYENIKIDNAGTGFVLTGVTSDLDSNNIITASANDTTIVGGTTADDISGQGAVYGIYLEEQIKCEVSRCVIRNISSLGTGDCYGIYLNNSSATSDTTVRLSGNMVYNIKRSPTSASSIVCGFSINGNSLVVNNIVYSLLSGNSLPASASPLLIGVKHVGGNSSYFNNTISVDNGIALNASSTAIFISSGSLKLRNNIFSNFTGIQSGVAKHYAVYAEGFIGFTLNLEASNNIYWAANSGGNGFFGFFQNDLSGLWQWIGKLSVSTPSNPEESGSAYVNPSFVSSTNLTFSGPTPAALSGTPIQGVVMDFYGTNRDLLRPTIGAIETNLALADSAAPSIQVTVNNSLSPVISASVFDNSLPPSGVVRLWYRLATSAGPYFPISPDISPVGQFNGVYQWTSSLQSMPGGIYQVYITARDNQGIGKNISVSPAPNATFSGFSANDPPNFASNPDANANTWTFTKISQLAGGTYPVGTSSTYQNLTSVAQLLSISELTGDVVFELQTDYNGASGEIFPIVFNQFLTSGGLWKVIVRPAPGVSLRETSGDPGSGNPLIVFNGIDRICFDGRPGSLGTNVGWLVRNKRAVASFSPTIQFINGAQSDSLKFLQVESGNTLTSASGAGTIQFASSQSVSNTNNVIERCIIRDRSDVTGVPAKAIFSTGITTIQNTQNIIRFNRIFNFSAGAIEIGPGSLGSNWMIDSNDIYMTSTATTAQTVISMQSTGAPNYIRGNSIGGTTIQTGGTVWIQSGNVAWKGISVNSGGADSVYIHGNTIRNISKPGTGGALFTGIEVAGTGASSIFKNTLGDNSIVSITLAGTGVHSGIVISGSGPFRIYNNLIANVNATNAGSASGLRAISLPITAGVNTTGGLIISNNIIHSLVASALNSNNVSPVLTGIYNSSPSSSLDISGNQIYNLQANGSGATFTVSQAILINNATSGGIISGNYISDIKNSSTATVQAIGISLLTGSNWSIVNNMIALGSNSSNNVVLNGIFDGSSGVLNAYHNTVRIVGSGIGTSGTQSFIKTGSSTLNLRNNIIVNERTGGGSHYAMQISTAGFTANRNTYYTAIPGNLGFVNSSSYDLVGWQSATGQDANSNVSAVNFVSNADLHLTGPSIGSSNLAGLPIVGITTDIDAEIRGLFPYKGADEIVASPLSVRFLSAWAKPEERNVIVSWKVAEERDIMSYTIEMSNDGRIFSTVGYVPIKNVVEGINEYKFPHLDACSFAKRKGVLFYRIRATLLIGHVYSPTISVSFGEGRATDIDVYPNPVHNSFKISIQSETNSNYSYQISDIMGRLIEQSFGTVVGNLVLEEDVLQNLSSGTYIVIVRVGEETKKISLIKN